ncbi:MAG: PASTA domain-containing protein [Candidatus Faecousia sp.]|nr:PASTA domain-containing protein [Candidatus Faecousia sp.]
MDADKYIGRLLDNRYEILEVIGTGGMAVVYKARCHRLNRLVAVKILKDEYSQDEEFRRRFHAEGQAVAMLSHPNIVSVYDVSTSPEADYIVMELVDGISLKQYMEKKGVLNWKETLHFSMQIAKALEHAHSRGIVHRDIKPHNVMVLKNGSVKVTDFGIARIMSKGNTLTKEALGSVHYISPEQAKGSRVDNRSDLYSLGVVMYEMMTGRPPYDGESPVAVAIQHINGGAPMPSTLNPNIPGGLEQIIMKAMAHDPNDRYESATAMLYDMEEFRKDPTILFDYNAGPTDAALHLTEKRPQEPAAPRTTAERVADRQTPRPRREPVSEPTRRTTPPVAGIQRPQTGSTARPTGSTSRPQTGSAQQRSQTGSGKRPQNTARPQTGAYAARSGEKANRPASSGQEAQRRREAEEKRSRNTTIAIISCSAVAVLALALILIAIFGNGVGKKDQTIQVPTLLGQDYNTLPAYQDFRIVLRDKGYSDKYDKDQIMAQEPKAGEMVSKDTVLYVDVSLGKEPENKTMENLVGIDQQSAKEFLVKQGVAEAKILVREEDSPEQAKGKVVRTDPAEGGALDENTTVTLYVSSGMMTMPNVEGMTRDQAEKTLSENGFNNVEIKEVDSEKESGTVTKQSLRANSRQDRSQTVTLEVSSGVNKKKVPNVIGRTQDEAKTMLAQAGFNYVEINLVDDSDKAAFTVLKQSENPNAEVDVTTTIVLEVSSGKMTVPNVVGKTEAEAKSALSAKGFTNVRTETVDSTETAGTVVNQSLDAESAQDPKTEIVLSVSNGGATPVTKSVTFGLLEEAIDPYTAMIKESGPNGKTVYEGTISDGASKVTVEVTGYGVMYYDIYINGKYTMTQRVEF